MKNTLIIGMWAFGFALAHYLSRTHPDVDFFAYEKDSTSVDTIRATRMHPYFFQRRELGTNIHLVDDLSVAVSGAEIILIVIPVPYIRDFIESIASSVRPGTLFVNCSKGIENTTLHTVSDMLRTYLWWVEYRYSVFSGGMIAHELVNRAPLGVTIGVEYTEDGDVLREIFASDELAVDITTSVRDIELFGSLKNIFALYAWYLEWGWYGTSSIGRSLVELYRELPQLIRLLGGSGSIDFGSYALGWDMIATCFGESRNRYFGRLVGSGRTPTEAVTILKNERKHAEGYETIHWLIPIIQKNNLPFFRKISEVFYPY